MRCDFQVGDQVVCIAHSWGPSPRFKCGIPAQFPLFQSIYEVAEVVAYNDEPDEVFLGLKEITLSTTSARPRFSYRGFRRVRPTSIESLERLTQPEGMGIRFLGMVGREIIIESTRRKRADETV